MSTDSKNISSLFLNAAKLYPTTTAIIEGERDISYSVLEKEVLETVAYFKGKGIQKGDRVLVFVPMSIDLYRIVLALFYMGATAVFLDEWVSKKRLELCCEIASCKGFIGVPKARLFAFFSKELRRIPIKLRLKKRIQGCTAIAEVDTNTSALITFTTGSTGTPKAADRTHSFLKEQFNALIDEIEPKPEDVDMPVLPIVLFVNLGIGCTSVIADFKMTKPELMNAPRIIDQIQQNKVTRITASPFFIKKIAERVIHSTVELPKVEKIFTGGAPVFPNEAKIYNEAFPQSVITIVYGSTEAEPISSIDSKELVANEQQLSFGLPVGDIYHKTDLKIIELTDKDIHHSSLEELNSRQVKNGEIGEIIVAGSHVLKKYYNNEEAFKNNKIIVDHTIWHRTGDSGLLFNGQLFLTGRCKQLIKKEDGFLSPFIIENKLQNMEGVDIGALISLNGEHILVLQSALKKEQLKELITDIPYDKMVIINQIPRDARHNSKIDYDKLGRIISVDQKVIIKTTSE